MNKRRYRAVLIGAAHMHILELSKACMDEPLVELVAMSDFPPEIDEYDHGEPYTRSWNLDYIQKMYGLKRYVNCREMLDSEKPDFALITTETSLHEPAFVECAQRGVAASIEKPMALTLQSGIRMTEMSQRYQTPLAINWPIAWRPWFEQSRSLLAEGAIGKLIKLRYIAGHSGPLGPGARHRGVNEAAAPMSDEQRAGTWWYHAAPGGGSAYDMLSYGAMIAAWINAEPVKEVLGLSLNARHAYTDIDDDAIALIRYPNAIGVIEGTWNGPSAAMPPGPELYGSEGMLRSRRVGEQVMIERIGFDGMVTEFQPSFPAPGRKNIADAFVQLLSDGIPLPDIIRPEVNLTALAVLEACRASFVSGRWEPSASIG